MSNSINSVSVDVLVSVLASFNAIVNEDRAVKEAAIESAKNQISILETQIKTCEAELATMVLTTEMEEYAKGVVNSLPSTLSDGIKTSTALQCLAERFGKQVDIVFQNAGAKGASLSLSEKSPRESKEDFRARLVSSLSHTQEATVKELSEKLGKNPAQVNTELNLLVALNQVQGIKRDGSRTIFYKLGPCQAPQGN